MMNDKKAYLLHSVLYDTPIGTVIRRFFATNELEAARAFAARATCYGRPAKVQTDTGTLEEVAETLVKALLPRKPENDR